MAWNAQWMDTFAHYPIAQIVQLRKWTSSPQIPTAITISDGSDTMQGIAGGFLSKTLAGGLGRIVATRGARAGGGSKTYPFICTTDTGDHTVGLALSDSTTRLSVILPVGSPITSTQISFDAGRLYNFEMAFLFGATGGTQMVYEVYVDGVKLLDIGSAVTTSDLPSMTQVRTFSGVEGGLAQRSWIATKLYSGSGGVWGANDLYGNVKRALLYPTADGSHPASTPGRRWTTDITTGDFTPRVNEIFGDSGTSFIIDTTNPFEAPIDADKASWITQTSPSDVPNTGAPTDVPHVQVSTLVIFSGATGTLEYMLRDRTAGDPDADYHTVPLPVLTSWGFEQLTFGIDPRSGSPWSKSALDTLELGVIAYDIL